MSTADPIRWVCVVVVLALAVSSSAVLAGDESAGAPSQVTTQDDEDLAKKLANPVASLISIPLDLDYDQNIGPSDNGERLSLTAKPVVPITLSEGWNLISRTVMPLVYQNDIFPGAGDQFGLGDTLQSFFFSPAEPTEGGLIWGVGPAFLLPTATDDLLGSEKWGPGRRAPIVRPRSRPSLSVHRPNCPETGVPVCLSLRLGVSSAKNPCLCGFVRASVSTHGLARRGGSDGCLATLAITMWAPALTGAVGHMLFRRRGGLVAKIPVLFFFSASGGGAKGCEQARALEPSVARARRRVRPG